MMMRGAYSRHWRKRNACRILVAKPEGKRPLGISRRKRENNIKMDLGEMRWSGLARDRNKWRFLVCMVMNLQVR
jgi:hypothetical protein